MRDIFILLAFAGMIPAILFRPYVGALVWAYISYLNPHRFTWGIAFDFRYAYICAIVTVIAWVLSREPKKLPLRATTIFIVLLSVWLSTTTLFALAPGADAPLERLLKILFMALITLGLMQSRERIHALVWVIVVSIGSFGVKGGIWFLTTGGAVEGGRVLGPPGTFMEGNNGLAVALVMVLPLMLFLRSQSHYLWVRIGLSLAVLLGVAAILGTFSRGSFVALAAIALALVLRSPKRIQIGVLVLVSGLAIGLFAPERWVERIESIGNYEEDASSQGRIELWKFGWSLALDRPVLGGGFDAWSDPETFARYSPSGATPKAYHNTYFQALGDHGFVGLGILLLLGMSTLLSIKRVKRLTRGRPELMWANELIYMLEFSLVGWAVGSLFYSLLVTDLIYHLIIITLLVQIVVEREIRATPVDTNVASHKNFGMDNRRRPLHAYRHID